MELHQLRYFCAVVRKGNFSRAAEDQRVAQPSLSQQIIKLENELGAKLFDRFPRSARLTSFGRAFLPKAEAILRQVAEARTEIQEMTGAVKGEVSIGAIPTIAPYLLPSALARFTRKHPGVTVSVVEEITPLLLDQLRQGKLDMALLALPVPGVDLICEELIREIKNEPFLLLKEGHCFRENTLLACRRSRVRPNIVFESGQFASIIAMVSAGIGISVVPAMAVEKHSGCSFIRIRDESSMRRVGLVQLKDHFPTRAQRALAEYLRANHFRFGLQSSTGWRQIPCGLGEQD